MASGDLDGDGHPEVVIVNLNQQPTLLKNTNPSSNAVTVTLRGTESNRNAIGARVQVLAGGRRTVRAVVGGGSYYSHSEFALHFGLGHATEAETLEITWPSGHRQRWSSLVANRKYVFTEGSDEFESSPFRTRSD